MNDQAFAFLNMAAYSIHHNNPFSTYGEAVIILGQVAFIILLIWSYNKTVSPVEKLCFLAIFGIYSAWLLTDKYVPEHFWPFFIISNNFLSNSPFLNFQAYMPEDHKSISISLTNQLVNLR
jgi:hypothetical protein